MTIIVICFGDNMSLVRMCTVTVSLFRMCLCMCLRARERERRRETSSKGSDVDLVPIPYSSLDECMENGELELRIQHLQLSDKPFHILAGLSLRPTVEADDLKSLVGPYSPKRQLAECKEPQQVEPRTGTEKAEEMDRQLICSRAASPVQILTIAWSECEYCAVESTSCTAHHNERMGDGNRSLEVVVMEEKLKTLVDELLETDTSTYFHGACPADLGRSCQRLQLPNQIMATVASSGTI